MKRSVGIYLKIVSVVLSCILCVAAFSVFAVSAESETDCVSFFIEKADENNTSAAMINIGINAPKDKVYSGNFRIYYDTRFLERESMSVNADVLNDYYDAYEFEIQEGEIYLEFCNYQTYVPEGKSVLMTVGFNFKSEKAEASFDEEGFMNSLFNFESYSMKDKEENGLEVTAPDEYTLGKTFVVLMGDSDCSGNINVKDATLIQKVIAKIHSMDEALTFASDVTADGTLNIRDATAIQKYCAHIEVQAEIGELNVYKQ